MISPLKAWPFFAIAFLWKIGSAALGQELTARELLEKCIAMQKRTDCISYSCARRFGKIPEAGQESPSGFDYHIRRQGKLIDFNYTQFRPVRGKQANQVIEGRYLFGEDYYAGYSVDHQTQEKTKAGWYGKETLENQRMRFFQEGQSSANLDGYFFIIPS